MDKFVLHYVDCCSPDYFRGHHLPVLQAIVDGKTTRLELANGLFNAVKEGVLDNDPRLPADWTWEEMERALNECIFFDEDCNYNDIVFPELEKIDIKECDDCLEYCCAFFVIETIKESTNDEVF